MSVQLKRWTREEYERLVALGVLGPDDRVQLVEGEIVEMAPQGPAHSTAIALAAEALRRVSLPGTYVRIQAPLALGEHSEPEPDVAVVPGDLRAYRDHHPTSAVLVVEVADATVDFDRSRKAAIYAAAGIPEYWILNLPDSVLEVYREPLASEGGLASYQTAVRLSSGEQVNTLGRPNARIEVADLLP